MRGNGNWMFDRNLPIGSFYYDRSQMIWRIGEGTPIEEVQWATRLTDEDIGFLRRGKIDPVGLDCRIRQSA